MKKIFSLFAALTLCVGLFAKTSVITYTAKEKLQETSSTGLVKGLHLNSFYAADNTQLTVTHTFDEAESVGTITLNGEVAILGDYAFYYCDGLTSITIPNSVTTIGVGAFYGCSGLTSVIIGNSVTTIGNSAFCYCDGLTSITIPNSVTTIGGWAFSYCDGLASITIPNSVTTIGNSAFAYCYGLTSIDVDAANTHYTSIDGVLFNYAKDILIQYPIGNTRTAYTIPNSVTTIGDRAFAYCSSLTSVTIPNSVTTIGVGAFSDCYGLTSITIPNSVTTIGDYAFEYCDGLTSVTFLGNACQNNIGEDAFYNVGSTTPALLTLPDNWTGTLPDEDGNWYGGNFELSEDPSALPNVDSKFKIQNSKLIKNGQLIIDANGKRYNAVGF